MAKEFMLDAKGNQIHIQNIKQIDLDRDALVREIVAQAESISALMAAFRESALALVDDFVTASALKYKAKLGGEKGNVVLTTFDGEYKVQVAVAEKLSFDERLQAAKVLIDKCLKQWTKDSPIELLAIVNDAFEVDKAGKISPSKVLLLRKHDIQHPDWKRAMEAISDSLNVVNSKRYIRVHKRKANGEYDMLPLSIARS